MSKQKLMLTRETEINGKKVKEIEYDLDSLTGEAMEIAMKELAINSYIPSVQEVDPLLHAHLFAQSANLDYLDIRRLSIKDYSKATTTVRNFFAQDLMDSQGRSSSEE